MFPTADDNAIIVTSDNQQTLAHWGAIFPKIDVVQTPVRIRACVATVTYTDQSSFGIRWLQDNATGSSRLSLSKLAIDSATGAFTAGIGIPLNSLSTLDIIVDAAQTTGKFTVLNRPLVITKSGTIATFSSGREIPLVQTNQVVGAGTQTSTTYKTANFKFSVLPVKIDKDHIALTLDQTNSDVLDTNQVTSANAPPTLSTQGLTNQMTLKPGQTVAIGGMVINNVGNTTGGVPGLSKIPLIGGLFKTHKRTNNRQEIILLLEADFYTPGQLQALPLNPDSLKTGTEPTPVPTKLKFRATVGERGALDTRPRQ